MFEVGELVEFRIDGTSLWMTGHVYMILHNGPIIITAGQPISFYDCSPENVRKKNEI